MFCFFVLFMLSLIDKGKEKEKLQGLDLSMSVITQFSQCKPSIKQNQFTFQKNLICVPDTEVTRHIDVRDKVV